MFCSTKPEFPESENYVNYMNCKKVTCKYKTGPIENISIPFSVKQRNKKKSKEEGNVYYFQNTPPYYPSMNVTRE